MNNVVDLPESLNLYGGRALAAPALAFNFFLLHALLHELLLDEFLQFRLSVAVIIFDVAAYIRFFLLVSLFFLHEKLSHFFVYIFQFIVILVLRGMLLLLSEFLIQLILPHPSRNQHSVLQVVWAGVVFHLVVVIGNFIQ
jgi:hypothetical protein